MSIDPTYPMSLAHRSAEELLRLPDPVLAKIRYDFDFWALPHQLAPKDYDVCIWYGGRGGGKSFAAAQECRRQIDSGVKRIGLLGLSANKVRNDMIRGPAGILAAFPPGAAKYNASQARVVFYGGKAEALILTASKPDNLRSGGLGFIWMDEFSAYGNKAEEVYHQARMSNREQSPKLVITTNTRPHLPFLVDLVNQAKTDPRIVAIRASSFDNFNNLPENVQRYYAELAKTQLGRAEIWGEFWQPEGVLWKREWFKYRPCPPIRSKVVVAVDPSGTDDGDETGIVVAAKSGNDGYILEDISGHHPSEGEKSWPKLVVQAARRHRANYVLIERNRGLNFLRALLRPHDPNLAIKEVYTNRNKEDRALPIAQFYELGRVYHDHRMEKLEQQMLSWDPRELEEMKRRRKATSPDRLDAACMAIGELGLHLAPVAFQPRNVPFPSMFADDD